MRIVCNLLLIFIVLVLILIVFVCMMYMMVLVKFLFSLRTMLEYRYFKDSEFKKAVPSCSIYDMDSYFMEKLDGARAICSVPFVINSAYRTKEYEFSKGRSGTSSHCKGLAVDISCLTSVCRLKIIIALIAVGFRRIGVYPTFIHVDSDTSKPACFFIGKFE